MGSEYGDFNQSATEEMDRKIRKLTAEGFQVHVSHYLQEAWRLFQKDPGSFILFALVVLLINGVLGFLLSNIFLYGSSLVQMVLGPPLFVGFIHVGRKIDRDEPYEFNDFFEGFNRFKPLALAGLVSGVLTSIGFMLCILPGIYLMVAYAFTYLIIWFGQREDFWEAMEASRKMITEEWFNFFFLIMALILINILGMLALGVGILITMPISAIAIYVAFDDIIGIPE